MIMKQVSGRLCVGDWRLLHLLAVNMEPRVFGELMEVWFNYDGWNFYSFLVPCFLVTSIYGTPASFTIISFRSWLTRWWMAPRVRNSLVFLHALPSLEYFTEIFNRKHATWSFQSWKQKPSLEYFTEIFKHKHAKKLLGPSNRENKNCSEVLIKNHYNISNWFAIQL